MSCTKRGISVRLLIVGEEVMTGTVAVEHESHDLGVADEHERTNDVFIVMNLIVVLFV